MRRDRFVLSDSHWALIAPLLPGKAPWRDLPPGFGAWNSIFRRFRRWAQSGVFDRIFEALSGEADFEYVLIDGTIVSVHQKASGAKGGLAIRPSAGRKAA